MMAHPTGLARESGCDQFLPDTPMANVLSHCFSYRAGLVAGALGPNIEVAG